MKKSNSKREPMSMGAFAAIPFLFALMGVGGVVYATSTFSVITDVEQADKNEAENKNLENELDEAKGQTSSLEDQLAQLEKEKDQLNATRDQLIATREAQREMVALQEKYDQIQAALEESRAKLKGLEEERERIYTFLAELENVRQEAVRQQKRQAQEIKVANADRESVQAALANLQEKLKSIEQHIKATNEQIQELMVALGDTKATQDMQARLVSLRRDDEKLQASLKKAKTQLQQLKEEKGRTQERIKELSKIDKELTRGKTSRARKLDELVIATRKEEQSVADFQAHLEDVKRKIEALKGQIQELNAALGKIEATQEARNQLASLREQYAQLQAALKKVLKELKPLVTEKENLTAKMKKLQVARSTANQEGEQHSHQVGSAEEEYSRLEKALAELRVTMRELTQQIEAKRQEIKELESGLINAKTIRESESQLKSLEEEEAALRAALKEAQAQLQSLQEEAEWNAKRLQELAAQRTTHEELKGAHHELEIKVTELSDVVASLDEEIRTIMREIEGKGSVQAKDLVPAGTLQEAKFIECDAAGIHLMPEGQLLETEVTPSTKKLFLENARSTGYVVFLIRPDGFDAFKKYRGVLQTYNKSATKKLDFGYEPIDKDWALAYPKGKDSAT